MIGLGAASASATDADKCASAKIKAAAKYAACRLAADAKAKSSGDAADYTKCNDGQSSSWSKIEGKYTTACPTSGDQSAIQADVSAATSCVATELAGPSGSCDTSAEILCGNGTKEGTEVCDQSDLGGADCNSATGGVDAFGTLSCAADCEAFDTSACIKCPVTGTVVDGQCWVLGNAGDSCIAACALNSMAYSSVTEAVTPGVASVCGYVLGRLTGSFIAVNIGGPPNTGCAASGSTHYIATTVTDQGNFAGFQRACACN
jgi:hypothetical protein